MWQLRILFLKFWEICTESGAYFVLSGESGLMTSVKFYFLVYKYFSDVHRSRGNIIFQTLTCPPGATPAFHHQVIQLWGELTPLHLFCHFQLCRCRNTTQSGQSETNSCRNTPQCQWVYFCCGFSSELTGAADTSSWEETHITWRADEALLPPVGTERYCNNNVITVYMQL